MFLWNTDNLNFLTFSHFLKVGSKITIQVILQNTSLTMLQWISLELKIVYTMLKTNWLNELSNVFFSKVCSQNYYVIIQEWVVQIINFCSSLNEYCFISETAFYSSRANFCRKSFRPPKVLVINALTYKLI